MFPFGLLTLPDDKVIVDRPSQLTADEQQAQMTLWAISKSPLFSGSDLRYLDARTLALLTNSVMLDMNSLSTHNQELEVIDQSSDARVWVALDPSGTWFVAFCNLGSSSSQELTVTVSFAHIRQALVRNSSRSCGIDTCVWQDVWSGQQLGSVTDPMQAQVASHGARLYSVTCKC